VRLTSPDSWLPPGADKPAARVPVAA
jgi:hypothetical protein